MRKIFFLLFSIFYLNAQGDINIFGYFQSSALFIDERFNVDMGSTSLFKDDNSRNEFKLQQLNLFAQKDLGSNFSAWINLEFVNDFSTRKSWGSFQVEEAWVKYEHTEAFNIKMGLFIPSFNRFNEIKNRMPLIPYIFRPIIYEATYSEIIEAKDYVPERGFLDFFGSKNLSDDIKVSYSFYLGQSDPSFYVSGKSDFSMPTGTDTLKSKLFGGRVGFEYDFIKLGFSGTIDKQPINKKEIDRKRFGADFSLNHSGVFIEGEYIKVYYDLDKIDLEFYYATLGYDINEYYTIYGTYSLMTDESSLFFKDGMKNYLFGFLFKPSMSVTIKTQYAYFAMDEFDYPIAPGVPSKGKFRSKTFGLAASVLF